MQGPEDSRPAGPAAGKATAARPSRKGAPPPQGDTLGALDAAPDAAKRGEVKDRPAKAAPKKRTEPLNFRVSAEFRRAFKRAAAAQDCKKVELLERIFAEWTARNPA